MQPKLLIALETDGTVTVQGPVANKVLCYGMLELARDAVREFEPPAVEVTTADRLRAQLGRPMSPAN